MATFKLDQYIAEAKVDPFVLDLGEGNTVSLSVPTSDVLVEVTETPVNQTRRILMLLCGEDQFDQVWVAVRDLPASVLQNLLLDMLRHFDLLGEVRQLPGGSRASRR